jgi:hypothetical protein
MPKKAMAGAMTLKMRTTEKINTSIDTWSA